MDGHSYLGIYLSRDSATAVCLGSQGRDVPGCFSVSVEEKDGLSLQKLAGLVAEGCAQRELKFTEVAVALDCTMFMQHDLHSEFTDPKQIAATVRFDTEEALATDITDVAIAFRIISSDQAGSKLAVFTAQRKILSEVIDALQSNNLDPIAIEPDVNCLSRFICSNIPLSGDVHPLFGILSRRAGYFIVFGESQVAPTMRTFLVGAGQDRAELFTREVRVTSALAGKSVNYLRFFDSAGFVNCRQLGEKLGIEAGDIDFGGGAGPEILAGCADQVGFAIAYGAALSHLEKVQSINFRNDFMPYQGKKVRLQSALKFLGMSVTVLMLAVGMYFQLRLLQENRYTNRLREKFGRDYSRIMLGEKLSARSDPVTKLAAELRRIRNVKEGLLSVTGEESVSAKLTLVLEAFNKCAKDTDLKIDSIAITSKTIRIEGDTSNRGNTLKLFESIKGSGLEILQQGLDQKGGRDNFYITIEPKK